jgi:hypothetical protein
MEMRVKMVSISIEKSASRKCLPGNPEPSLPLCRKTAAATQLPGCSSIGTRINKTFYFKGAVFMARMTTRALPPDQFLAMPTLVLKK